MELHDLLTRSVMRLQGDYDNTTLVMTADDMEAHLQARGIRNARDLIAVAFIVRKHLVRSQCNSVHLVFFDHVVSEAKHAFTVQELTELERRPEMPSVGLVTEEIDTGSSDHTDEGD